MRGNPIFHRYVGIDYSGAQTATSSLTGLRVYLAERVSLPSEVGPPPSPRKYWTRRGIAEWLQEILLEGPPTLVGIDHGFSFPRRYFEWHQLPFDWTAFLEDFQRHWPTDEDHCYVDFVRDGVCGNVAARSGDPRWQRLRKCALAWANLSSNSTRLARWQSPLTLACRGYLSSTAIGAAGTFLALRRLANPSGPVGGGGGAPIALESRFLPRES